MSFKKQWIILYFILLKIIGSLGFYFIGGDEWTILDIIFMTIITLSTISYGEVHPLTNLGKLWSILLIFFGVTGIGALIRALNEQFNHLDFFKNKKIKKNIMKL